MPPRALGVKVKWFFSLSRAMPFIVAALAVATVTWLVLLSSTNFAAAIGIVALIFAIALILYVI